MMAAIQQVWGLSGPTVSTSQRNWSIDRPCHRPALSSCSFISARTRVLGKAVESGGKTAPSSLPDEDQVVGAEASLLEALLGMQGRVRATSDKQLQEVRDAVKVLEELKGLPNATGSPFIDGTWRLVYLTRPATASPIQRTFVGINSFEVFQSLALVDTDEKRVCNTIRFSEVVGELKIEAAASIQDERRILFQFDRAAFSFKFLPFKVPYPVPFRLLGDKAKGWIDITYLSPSGAVRIARGNKGTTFVLQRSLDARQQLLQTVSSGANVEKAIDEFLAQHSKEVNLAVLPGRWRNLWRSQAARASWLQRSTATRTNWQIIRPEDGALEHVVEVFPGVQFRAEGSTVSVASSAQRCGVQINRCMIEIGTLRIPFPNTSEDGYLDILYIDNKLRISRGNDGDLSVDIREPHT